MSARSRAPQSAARAPRSQVVELRLGPLVVQQAEGQRHRRHHGVLVDEAAPRERLEPRLPPRPLGTALRLDTLARQSRREAVEPALREPVRLLDRRRASAPRRARASSARPRSPRTVGQLGEAAAGLDPHALLVDLLVRAGRGRRPPPSRGRSACSRRGRCRPCPSRRVKRQALSVASQLSSRKRRSPLARQ